MRKVTLRDVDKAMTRVRSADRKFDKLDAAKKENPFCEKIQEEWKEAFSEQQAAHMAAQATVGMLELQR